MADVAGLLAQQLVGAVGMVRRRKTQGDNLLRHPLRAQILAAITQRRGLLVQDLQRELACSRSTLRHHLTMLTSEGLVQAMQFRHQTRLFPAGMDTREQQSLSVLMRGRTWELARRVVETPGTPQSGLTTGLQMTRKLVRKYLDRLVEQSLVQERSLPPFRTYYPTEHLLAAMAEIERLEGLQITARPPEGMNPVDPASLNRRFMAPVLLVPRENPPQPEA